MAASNSVAVGQNKTDRSPSTKTTEKYRHSDTCYEYETDVLHSKPQYGPPKTYQPDIDTDDGSSDDGVISIDLTDPEDLMLKLELLDLTDEETDELLQRALDVNKQLRVELGVGSAGQRILPSASSSAPGLRKSSGTMLPPIQNPGTITFPSSRLLSAVASSEDRHSSKSITRESHPHAMSAGLPLSSQEKTSSKIKCCTQPPSSESRVSRYDPPSGTTHHARLIHK